ncbi:MAG: GDSL-type esterase/lipase family protein [Thermoleophilia bacterium]
MRIPRLLTGLVSLAVLLVWAGVALGAPKPPPPAGVQLLAAGQVPTQCAAGATFDPYGSNYGYYYSKNANAWLSAPWCYPRWGFLEASASGVVAAGQAFTVTAIPTDGSNSAAYAPETKTISWSFPGKVVAGCGNADLSCTVIPTTEAGEEWSWFEFKVSMPRTFFIDSPGEFCAGQHLCGGVTTHAWAFVGVPPDDGKLHVRGAVRDAEGKGVKGVPVTASGPGGGSDRTDESGSYDIVVKKGAHTVSAAGGYCVVGKPGCTKSVRLSLPPSRSVDFGPPPEHTLSGAVLEQTCTEDTCSRAGLAGVTVRAKGGPGGPEETTTGADGTYSLTLSAGTWEVAATAPDRDFEHIGADGLADGLDSTEVSLSADRSGVDFLTCASATGAEARRLAVDGPVSCSADGIDWEVEDRLTEASGRKWGNASGLPSFKEVYPSSWQARVFLTAGGHEVECSKTVRWVWEATPTGPGRVLKDPKPGCATTLEVSHLGEYGVIARKQVKRKGRFVAAKGVKPIKRTIQIKDWLLVGVGDSNGSGEGNPQTFFYERCNRGTASYQYQTALYVERQDPHTSVTFVHTACSGASIFHLVDTPYAGTRKATPKLAPQFDQIGFLVVQGAKERKRPQRKIDAVIVSIGVNDLAFGPIMAYCTVNHDAHLADQGVDPNAPRTPDVDYCQERPVVPVLNEDKRIKGFVDDRQAGLPMRTYIERLQQQLPARYKPLASALKRPLTLTSGGLGVTADRVFISRLPDFSWSAPGEICDTRDNRVYSIPWWGPTTWQWLSDQGTQLAQTVRSVASTYGWHYVDYNAAAFASRGFCKLDGTSLFAGILETATNIDTSSPVWVLNPDLAGGFHPNAEAHLLAAAEEEPLVCSRLYKKPDCTGNPR